MDDDFAGTMDFGIPSGRLEILMTDTQWGTHFSPATSRHRYTNKWMHFLNSYTKLKDMWNSFISQFKLFH